MWSFILLGVHEEAAQAQDHTVPLRQNMPLAVSWQFASELPSADWSAYDNDHQSTASGHWAGNHSVLPAAPHQEGKVLLPKRQGNVLHQVYPQTHPTKAWGHQLFSQR